MEFGIRTSLAPWLTRIHDRFVRGRSGAGPVFCSDWFSSHIPIWEKYLKSLQGKRRLRFLEIGSFEGRSACWLLENVLTHPSSHLTCIDLPHRVFGPNELTRFPIDPTIRFQNNVKAIGAEARVTLLHGKSPSILKGLSADRFHFIYIDGDHRAPAVAMDAFLAWQLLKVKGILVFDDYLWEKDRPLRERPYLAVNTFLKIFEGHYDLLHRGYQVIVRKTKLL